VRLELERARLHLRRLRTARLHREDAAQRRERRRRLRERELAAREPQERFGRCGRGRARLERRGELAVGERGAEALDGDVGRRAVREVCGLGGDQIWV
jgi:hypothetical protein